MNIVFFLIPLGLLIFAGIVWAFIWAVNNGQFEDLDRPAHSILYDSDESERDEQDAQADGAGREPSPREDRE